MTTDETLAPGLLASGDMYSTAFQFYSHINADVDPRTGMYSASVDLATGEGNHLRGPHLPFRLSYSAADRIDDGFGTGWRLGLTELDLDTGLLTLSSGDSHKVERLLYHEPAHFPDRKLDSCSLMVMDPEHRTAVVEHVTGVVEHLEAMSYPTNLLRPVRIVNPGGDSLQLAWEWDALGISRLTRVVDGDGEVLMQVDYADLNNVKLTLHLAGAAHREATVPLEMHFRILGGQLQHVAIPLVTDLNESATAAGDEAVWKFEYRVVDIMMLLASVTSPDGLRDSVEYDTKALTLPPGGLLSHMPAVSMRTRSLVSDATNVIRESRYTYRNGDLNHNFYGYPTVQSWEDRNDQLLHMPGADAYTYGSTESQCQDGSLLCTVERNYNHFHLITNEKTTRGNVVQDVVTGYGIEESTSFENQKASFQLPHRVTTTCYDLRLADIRQITFTDSSYDDYGNVLSRYDSATDTTETSTYYPKEGETGLCPPDPLGKVRRLRSRTTSPGKNGGPIRTTQYRYLEVPVRDTAKNWPRDRTYYIQASGETSTESTDGIETTLVRSEQSFVTDQGNQHGSLRQETREQDGLAETRTFTYETDDVAGTVTTHTTHTTHDGVVNTTSETLHLISGLVRSTVDALGNKAEFTYDALGRRTSEVLSPDHADYRVETRWNYQLSMSERWVERIGITGLPHRVWMDEQGRTIRRAEPLPDGTLMTVHELEYDGFGQLVSETQIDRMRGDTSLRLKTTYAYDDWGRCSRMTSPDGSTTLSETALVQEPLSFGDEVIARTMQWQSYGTGEKTGWWATYLDAADRQRRAQAGTWSEADVPVVASTTTWEYDGLGRCVRMEDPLGKVTRQAWDGYDRLIRSDLPDGTAVLRDYAPGHEDEFVARLAIVPPERDRALRKLAGKAGELELGTRTWDGLGRLKKEQAGSLTTSHAYVPNQMSSDTKTMPSGNTLQMVYDLRLREVLLGSTLLSPDGAVEAVLTQATYDHVMGLPTGIVAEGGSMTIIPDYLGRMTDQEIALTGDLPRGCHVSITPGGLALEKTGTDGVEQIYDYDDKGRLKSVIDEDATIELVYDELSRLDHRTTRSADGRSVTQRIAYDALGRVHEQTWEHTEASTTQIRSLAFGWRADDKVSERRWYGGDATLLRTETMDYDDRGRLILHGIDAVAGEHPLDETGKPYVKQEFEHDCLDNLLAVTTTLLDGRVNLTRYGYDAVDFDRLVSVSNSLDGYPGYGTPLKLLYDANGNLIDDGQGRTLQWDGAGRLASVTLADSRQIIYIHGPDGRVSSVTIDDVSRYRYREDGAIAFEVDASEGRRFIRAEGGIVAETRLAGAIRETFLLGTDPQGSVVTESVPDVMA